MKYQCAMLVVGDLAKTRKFYEEVLGLRVVMDFGANITFEGGFALQTKPSWSGLAQLPEADIRPGGNDFELYFEEEDLDRFLEHLRAFPGVEMVHPLAEYPWGQRVVRFYDPDRHIVEVGESMETVIKGFLKKGLSPEEVAQRTMYPLEFVTHCME